MLRIEDVPSPALRTGGVIVRNVCSLVSSGTERAIIELAEKGLISKARSRPDLVRQVIDKVKSEGLVSTYRKVMSKLESPIPLGYSSAGVVEEVSPELSELAVGERVACAGFGYASHAELVFVPKNLVTKLPSGVSFRDGSFVTLGAIALQGIRQADVRLGECVAVMGLGLLGQLTVQMLKASGCRVVGLDIDKNRIDLAIENGLDLGVDNSSSSYKRDVLQFSSGIGVDRVIVTAASASSELISQAAEIARDRGHITVVGAVGMNLDRKPFYDKELSLNLSRSYGPGRYDREYEEMGQDYPLPYVRWTERRNMGAFLDLIAEGKVRIDKLVTHTFDSADAEKAYGIVTGKCPEPHLAIILTYPAEVARDRSVGVLPKPMRTAAPSDKVVIGACGAGSFATGVVFPVIRSSGKYDLRWLSSANGVKAVSVARQFGFQNATTSLDEMLADAQVGAVFVLTPHNFHCQQVVRALHSGKWVFVEKPLATTEEELLQIIEAKKLNSAQLMVGFNRRHSPAASIVRNELAKNSMPALYNYRVNAGFVPKGNSLHDDRIGKGRIIGEACHFIDLISFLARSVPTDIMTYSADMGNSQYLNSDNVHISFKLADGSAAAITYAAVGGSGMPKERLEVFSAGTSYVIDDFKTVQKFANGKVTALYRGSQDKGHKAEFERFATSFLAGEDFTEDFENAVSVTRATFAAVKSLSTGVPQKVG